MTYRRTTPYTSRGITRVACFRCGLPSVHQWQICADGNTWRAICLDCDVALNRLVLEWMGFDNAAELADRYEQEQRASCR